MSNSSGLVKSLATVSLLLTLLPACGNPGAIYDYGAVTIPSESTLIPCNQQGLQDTKTYTMTCTSVVPCVPPNDENFTVPDCTDGTAQYIRHVAFTLVRNDQTLNGCGILDIDHPHPGMAPQPIAAVYTTPGMSGATAVVLSPLSHVPLDQTTCTINWPYPG